MRSRPTWRNFVNLFFILVALTIYLNIGWTIGAYYETNILPHKPQTTWQTVWAGGFGFLAGNNPDAGGFPIIAMLLWPTIVLIWLCSWLVFGLYYLGWLVFAGGVGKLLGLA
mgnify:FL=1